MSDSWRLRNELPGLAQRYSKSSVLRTSTMKSEPGRSTVRTSALDGASAAGAFSRGGAAELRCGSGEAGLAVAGLTTSAAVPAAAARKKSRRFTESFIGLRTAAPPGFRRRDYSHPGFRALQA